MRPVYLSYGSHYTPEYFAAWARQLVRFRTDAPERLRQYLEKEFAGTARLTYKGRHAITLGLKAVVESVQSTVVYTQAFSCIAVEEGIRASGYTPQYVDIATGQLNLSVETLDRALSESGQKPGVVLVQHSLGFPADSAGIRAWCDAHGALLLEDVAQAYGAVCSDGMGVGARADIVVCSFGRDKIVDGVVGGAVIVSDRVPVATLPEQSALPAVSYRSQLRDALIPGLLWMSRILTPLLIGKVLFTLLRKTHLLSSPVLTEYTQPHRLGVLPAAAVLAQLDSVQRRIAERAEIAAVYRRLLDSQDHYAEVVDARLRPSWLRFPLEVTAPDTLAKSLARNGFHLTDRWYRKAVDGGTTQPTTVYRAGLAQQAERRAQTMLNLPTHGLVSSAGAEKLVHALVPLRSDAATAYQTRFVHTQSEWEAILQHLPHVTFLQSWEWGAFQEQLGKHARFLVIEADGSVVAAAQIIREPARRGPYLTIGAGPLVDWTNAELVKVLFEAVRRLAIELGCVFIRFRPQAERGTIEPQLLAAIGARRAPMHLNAEHTLKLDLTQSTDEIMMQMRKNTRYDIRKAEKLGIVTRISTDPAEIMAFYQAQVALAQRHQFVPFSEAFLYEQFVAFKAQDRVRLIHAYQGDQLLATAFVIFYGTQATYHYGISTPANDRLPGAHAVQWRAIQEAKQQGCTSYDFWGITEKEDTHHRFYGVSVFKRGFGGQEVRYVPAHDVPVSWQYGLVYLLETFRRKRRHL